MKRYLTMSPEGTRDYLFEESRARTHVEQTLANVFSSRAFCQGLSRLRWSISICFRRIASDSVRKRCINLSTARGAFSPCAPDSTAPIARLTATKLRDEALPIRLYYSQPVFKVSPQHSAQYDEVMQCGVELIGAPRAEFRFGNFGPCSFYAAQFFSQVPAGNRTYRLFSGCHGRFSHRR